VPFRVPVTQKGQGQNLVQEQGTASLGYDRAVPHQGVDDHALLWWDYFTGVAKCDYKLFAFALNLAQKKTFSFRRIFS